MTSRPVKVSLVASGGDEVSGDATLQEFSSFDRIRRAGILFGIFVLLAAALIPIPIIHLLGIPLMLVLGIVLGARQLAIRGRLSRLALKCPQCGGTNRLGGGMGLRSVTEPYEWMCEECRRSLTVRIDPR